MPAKCYWAGRIFDASRLDVLIQQEGAEAVRRIRERATAAVQQTNEVPRKPFGGDRSEGERVPIYQSTAVKLFGPSEQPEVNGRRKPTLTPARYNAVQALIEAGEMGLSKDELNRKSGHGDARKALKGLADKDSDWKSVLLFAGKTGGRYRIR